MIASVDMPGDACYGQQPRRFGTGTYLFLFVERIVEYFDTTSPVHSLQHTGEYMLDFAHVFTRALINVAHVFARALNNVAHVGAHARNNVAHVGARTRNSRTFYVANVPAYGIVFFWINGDVLVIRKFVDM
eukprot:scaffold38535_cov33-Attheya_sp.AAC.2